MTYRISPSILSADFAKLGQEIQDVLAAGADWIHFDVMDNHYVPNLTFGPMVLQAIKPYAGNAVLDVHLMVEPVDHLIEAFAKAGANLISFHPEASKHIDRSLALIKSLGCKAGLAINPATPLTVLEHVMDKLDLILLMSVNPGFGGQSFIPQTMHKISQARQLIDAHVAAGGQSIFLEVDGGVNAKNIRHIAGAGVDTFVAGSAIFNAPNYKAAIDEMRQELAHV